MGRATAQVLFADLATPPQQPAKEDWLQDCDEIVANRLGPTALRMSRSWDVPEDVVHAFRETTFAWASLCATVLRQAQEPLSLLAAEGVVFAVTKGPGIALAYPSPVERPFSDVDIIVEPRDFARAMRVLGDAGVVLSDGHLLPWGFFRRWCTEAVNIESPGGVRLDVHHHIPPWVWGRGLTARRIIDSAQATAVWGGTKLPLASPLHNLLVASLHIFSDHNRPGHNLLAWRDLLLLLRMHTPDQVEAVARECGLVGWLRWVLSSYPPYVDVDEYLARLGSGPSLPHAWRIRARSSHVEPEDGALLYSLRLPVPQAAIYILGSIVPSPAFLRHRFPKSKRPYRSWWTQGATSPWR